MGGVGSTVVDAYNTSLTKTTAAALAAEGYSGVVTTRHALAISRSSSTAYNSQLVRNTFSAGVAGTLFGAASIKKDIAILIGAGSGYSASIMVDDYLVGRAIPSLRVARDSAAGISVGNYALGAGGEERTASYSSVVDAYSYA
jgi:hypothetical protein